MDRLDALAVAAFATGRALAAGRTLATGFAFGRGRAGLDSLTAVGLRALLTERFRAVGRFDARACPELRRRARGAGFRAFLADFAAARRFGAVRFRLDVFLAAARLRPAAFRPPLFFLPVCPERRRGARVAFRLAMGRPFAGYLCAGYRPPSYLDSFR